MTKQNKSMMSFRLPNSLKTEIVDYNFLTGVSLDLIIAVADLFNIDVCEVDIISCNPRIIYA